MSVNGYSHPTTPRLERLAKEGTTFRRCFTPASWTPPAHASLFTGLLPRGHGIHQGFGGEGVAPDLPLLAETLGGAGYETVCIIANGMVSDINGLTRGFEKQFEVLRTEDPRGTGKDALTLTESPLRPRTVVAEHGPSTLALPEVHLALPNAPAGLFERFEYIYRAVREPASAPGARKFIQVLRPVDGGKVQVIREELYDLASDPGETRNLLAPGGPPAERAAADRLRAIGNAGR